MTLKITALQIDQWAPNREAQTGLHSLIGKLVDESLPPEDIIRKDFTSDVGRHGFDGTLVTQRSHPYIPEGKSVWEMSVEKNIIGKANSDFDSRTCRAENDSTFIFVTARKWPGKDKWLANKQNSQWGEVRAYDANDLEQWLESSLATTVWLSDQMGKPQYHIQPPERFLKDWLNGTDPVFPSSLILQNRDEAKSRILNFVKQSHSNSSSIIFADTSDEALAFICAALDSTVSSKALVITEQQGINELLPWQRGFEQPHVLIVHTCSLAKKIPNEITNRNLLLVAEARGAVSFDPANESYLSLPRVSNFNGIKKSCEETLLLEKRTGGSLSALHRQLNCNEAKKSPPWAELEHSRNNRKFIWLAFIGGWDERHAADEEIICELSGVASFDVWHEFTDPLLTGEDAPLFHTREDKPQYKLFSRIDAFLTISQKIRGDEIDHLFKNIKKIYLEDDPNYHSADETGPHLYQKRKYSDALRGGIMDGLAILSYYNEKGALNCSDVKPKIEKFFDDIFTHDSAWIKLLDLLPQLAEINPQGFIKHLRKALNDSSEKITDLFSPRGDMILGFTQLHPPLLWALEGLAWNPNKLDSILKLLCLLQQKYESNIESNFMNRPSESMKSILRSWMPQTSATTAQRIQDLRSAYEEYPDEGVELALGLAGQDSVGSSTYMPIWRDDVLAKQVTTHADRIAIITEAINLVIDYLKNKKINWQEIACQAMDNFTLWGTNKAQEVADVIVTMPTDNDEDNRKLFDWAREWIQRCPYYSEDDDKRKFVSMYESLRDHFKPRDLTERYAYLFSNSAKWEFYEEDNSHKKTKKIDKNSWNEALSKIYKKNGIEGLINLLNRVECPDIVAVCLYTNYIAEDKFPEIKIKEYLLALLNSDLEIRVKRPHLSFLFYGAGAPKPMEASAVIAIIKPALEHITDASKKALLLQTLRIDQSEGRTFIDQQSNDVKCQLFSYPWQAKGYELRPQGGDETIPPESTWLVDRYLHYKRPRLALASFTVPEYIPIDRQFDILASMFTSNYDVGGDEDSRPSSYHIECMFKSLAKQYTDVDGDTLVQLSEIEMKFHNFLRDSEYLKSGGFILRRLASSPAYFVDIHKYVYRDEEGNIPDLNIPEANAEVYASAAWNVFYHLDLRRSLHFPWNSKNNTLDVEKLQCWIEKVRQLAKEAKMSNIIDQHIGKGLSHSRLSHDDLRPEYAICDIMKDNGSHEMYVGFRLGRLNSRGVVVGSRDKMGFTSAGLSSAYGEAANKLRHNYPDMAEVFDDISSSYRSEAEHLQAEEERRDMDFR